ncbi:SDR family oxidoreductase [Telmatospirillum sp. J64-1]|uniref:SDR family oxidoreductase n=1 Tax=Telmatospirillum sp. J64-1 TaxID=2502183 RepID=UPI00115EE499|nr:SDR family oxidoreductase [Telmatospirillum sp. J64-1]
MTVKLKPLNRQVMVITGATSGIGLATARMATESGVRLVIASRDEETLHRLSEELRRKGPGCVDVPADVANPRDVQRIADTAMRTFGGIDTWVNNAGVSIFGRLDRTPLSDHRRLFETNYWGVVHGSMIALPYLRRSGGALINIGSVASEVSLPEQAAYSASKHAVMGFTEGLRIELMQDNAPVSVTLIKPAGIDTPFREHARNYMGKPARVPSPVYAPHLVAEAILYAAANPTRDMVVGGGGKMMTTMNKLAPGLMDKVMAATMGRQQRTDVEPRPLGDALYKPGKDGYERSNWQGHVREHSAYTSAMRHPWLTTAALLGIGAAAFTMLNGRKLY